METRREGWSKLCKIKGLSLAAECVRTQNQHLMQVVLRIRAREEGRGGVLSPFRLGQLVRRLMRILKKMWIRIQIWQLIMRIRRMSGSWLQVR